MSLHPAPVALNFLEYLLPIVVESDATADKPFCKNTTNMKSLIQSLTAATVAIVSVVASTPTAKATNLTLDGSGFYELGDTVTYFGGKGPKQSGSYKRLGRDYYHRVTIGMDVIENRSNFRSGSLSFEFWGMDFFGATDGDILMTRGLNSLKGGRFYDGFDTTGWAVSLDDFRFPEISLWEFTRNGYKFRDALSFSNDARL
jgi:hypothetical protein